MIVFDTDGWAAEDRVERWREEFGRSVIRTEVVAVGERPDMFGVRMALLGGERLSSLDMRLRSVRKTRGRTWFSDGLDDLTFMLCLAGTVQFDTNGVRHILRRGEAALFSHVVPVDLHWDDARIVTLQVPRAALSHVPSPERLAGRVLGRGDPARAMLHVYLTELWRQGGNLTPRAERHLLELMAEGLLGSPTPAASRPGRAGPRLASLRRLIASRAAEGLRIDEAGMMLGVSARTLERDLASVGTSFADELANARLDRSLAELGGAAGISEIAFAVGFNDLSAFNRRFKARFGRSPSEEREARRARG